MIELRHATSRRWRDSIRSHGLIPGHHRSEYGPPPLLNAVYLYHANNVDAPAEIRAGAEGPVGIFTVRVPQRFLVADEDYFRYELDRIPPPPHCTSIYSDYAMASLEQHGVVAYPYRIQPVALRLAET